MADPRGESDYLSAKPSALSASIRRWRPESLSGRDRLVEALHALGFKLK